MIHNPIRSNIAKIYLIQILRWSMLVIPTFVLFLQDNGLSMQQVLITQAVFSIVIVVMEIPSGYFADSIGRKTSIIIGCILGFFGYVVYSLSYGFAGFLVAETFLGISASFISGADSAMLYDTLAELEETDNYQKTEGRKIFFQSSAEGIASIAGGLLALISLRFPFYIQTGILALAIPLAFSLKEPKYQQPDPSEWNVTGMLKAIKFALNDHPQVKWLIIYSGLVAAATLNVVWFIQPYFKLVGLPLALFGIAWAILQFCAAIFALLAHRTEALLGRATSLISLILLSSAGYFFISYFQAFWALPFLLIFYFVRGINGPVLKDYINRLIPSEIRATVLSVQSLITRVIFSFLGPILGYLTDQYSLSFAFLIAGLIFLASGLISIMFLYKHKVLYEH
ncbi:MAG: MFS transporter [Candidatus Doudnabacteria bacterium]|nr:MFS transporter [Candidatus Doudnabacteria bacterium]